MKKESAQLRHIPGGSENFLDDMISVLFLLYVLGLKDPHILNSSSDAKHLAPVFRLFYVTDGASVKRMKKTNGKRKMNLWYL